MLYKKHANKLKNSSDIFWQIFLCYNLFACLFTLMKCVHVLLLVRTVIYTILKWYSNPRSSTLSNFQAYALDCSATMPAFYGKAFFTATLQRGKGYHTVVICQADASNFFDFTRTNVVSH